MLVVNKGLSGQYHIFRGSAAREWLAQLDVVRGSIVLIDLPKERRERGRLFQLKAGTFALALDAEDVKDDVAKLAFLKCERAWSKQLRRLHGNA